MTMSNQKSHYEVTGKEFFANYGKEVAVSDNGLKGIVVPEFTKTFPELYAKGLGELLNESKFDEAVGGLTKYLVQFMNTGDEPIRFFWTDVKSINETVTRGFWLWRYEDKAIASDGERNWVLDFATNEVDIKDADVSRALADKTAVNEAAAAAPVLESPIEDLKLKEVGDALKKAGFDLQGMMGFIPVIAPVIEKVLSTAITAAVTEVIKTKQPEMVVAVEQELVEVKPEPAAKVEVKQPQRGDKRPPRTRTVASAASATKVAASESPVNADKANLATESASK